METTVNSAKTFEPIEMAFGVWIHEGPRNRVLDWELGLGSPTEWSTFGGISGPLKSIGTVCCSVYSNNDHSTVNDVHMLYDVFWSNDVPHGVQMILLII